MVGVDDRRGFMVIIWATKGTNGEGFVDVDTAIDNQEWVDILHHFIIHGNAIQVLLHDRLSS